MPNEFLERPIEHTDGDTGGEIVVKRADTGGFQPTDTGTRANTEYLMGSFTGATLDSSPDVLCVSDERESNARIHEAVAGHRPAERIETTTDPTVVPELVTVWNLECIVADADMEPLDGFDLRASLQEHNGRLSVIIVSTDPAADATVSIVAADADGDQGLAACLDEHTHDTAARSEPSHPIDRLGGLVESDSWSNVVSELETRVTRFPSVLDHRTWVTGTDGSLELNTEPDEDWGDGTVPAAVEAAAETAKPQKTDPPADSPSELATTAVYPLGETGAVAVDLVALTPAIDARLRRLTTVAGACLDHQTTVDDLESRFRQTAERNQQLSQFARTVSHDLNSPLSVIYGRIELALAEQSNAELHLQAARNAAERVDSLVTDHLQSIEAADAEDEWESVSIQTVAIQAWRIIDPSTARLQVEPQLETVEANAIRLQQLFENLIRNAIEHGSEESIGLGATESRDPHAVFDDDTESVTVTIKPTNCGFAVCDNGPGIPPEERETIFESGYTTTESGSGLGLHIVEEIVDSHGWEISVTESASGGARFEIDIQ